MKVSLSLMLFTVALICSTSVCKDDKINKTVSVVPNSTIGVVTTEDMQSITDYFSDHMGAVKRALYVIIGITAVVALYLGIRTYRSRKRKSKSYGLLSSSGGEHLELNALNSDSEDDYTVFESKPIY